MLFVDSSSRTGRLASDRHCCSTWLECLHKWFVCIAAIACHERVHAHCSADLHDQLDDELHDQLYDQVDSQLHEQRWMISCTIRWMISCMMQVSRQLASRCAELVGCQTELHQVHHMLAAAYAANAALQVRFRQASQPSPSRNGLAC